MALADVVGLDFSNNQNNFLSPAARNTSGNFLQEAELVSQNFTVPYNFDVSILVPKIDFDSDKNFAVSCVSITSLSFSETSLKI